MDDTYFVEQFLRAQDFLQQVQGQVLKRLDDQRSLDRGRIYQGRNGLDQYDLNKICPNRDKRQLHQYKKREGRVRRISKRVFFFFKKKKKKKKEEIHTLKMKTTQENGKRMEGGTIHIYLVPSPISRNNKKFSLPMLVRRTAALYQTKMRAPRRELVETSKFLYL